MLYEVITQPLHVGHEGALEEDMGRVAVYLGARHRGKHHHVIEGKGEEKAEECQ